MHESWSAASWIEERQQELRRVTEDDRDRYEEVLRSVAMEHALDPASLSARQKTMVGLSLLRALAHAMSLLVHLGSPTSVGPRAGSKAG
jgi:hypothetical protein